MPIECTLLRNSPQPREICLACGDYPFEAVDRGLYQREKHDKRGRRQHYCQVICSNCYRCVGYESPPWNSKAWKIKNAADIQRSEEFTTMNIMAGIFVALLLGALISAFSWL